ncbi:hypothetical protein ANCDUO_05281 [Ancylostoma duodenale]|uniref:Uncharacterized protein n=1 Tax=Ancylostoma duodenale TaxID=51022 RepID=A0A0C2GT26_9BILA|nr:hypothetical protein ANCDUO_05281 [Ancylostoma duodenale]
MVYILSSCSTKLHTSTDLKKAGPQGPLRFGKRRDGPTGPLRFGKRSSLDYSPLTAQQPHYFFV